MTEYIYGSEGVAHAVAATKVAFGHDLQQLAVSEIEVRLLLIQDNAF
jgi:hypothetical protein